MPMKTSISKVIALAFAAMLISVASASAAEIIKFGTKPTKQELEMKVYAPDTTARAVYLCDYGDVFYQFSNTIGFYIEYNYTKRIKVLKPEGVGMADVSIIFSDGESVRGLEANAYNEENGKVVKTQLDKKNVFEEKVSSKRKMVKFAIPNVKEGTILEYKYTLHSPLVQKINDWVAQKRLPVINSRLDITIPEYFIVNVAQHGVFPLVTERKEDTCKFSVITDWGTTEALTCAARSYRVEGDSIPALDNEPFVWSAYDYQAMIEFEFSGTAFPGQLMKPISTTWSDVEKTLKEDEQFPMNMSCPYEKELRTLDIPEPATVEQRVVAMMKLLHSKMKWNGQRAWYSVDMKKAISTGVGNSAEMNFIMMSMMRKYGIQCSPVVLSSRSNGRMPMIRASLERLSDMVVRFVDGDQVHYIDASDKYAYIDALPADVRVERAKVIGEEAWADLSNLSANQLNKTLNSTLSADGTLSGIKRSTRSGIFAWMLKRSYESESDSIKYVEQIMKNNDIEVESFSTRGVKDYGNRVVTDVKFTKTVDVTDDHIYFNPMIALDEKDNPFVQDKREYPVELPCTQVVNIISAITLPDGYEVEEMPQSGALKFNDGTCSCQYLVKLVGNQIQVLYKLNIGRQFFEASEYPDLKNFYQAVVEKNNQMVVLKKVQ